MPKPHPERNSTRVLASVVVRVTVAAVVATGASDVMAGGRHGIGRRAHSATTPMFRRLTAGREVTAIAWLPDTTIRFAERGGTIVDVRPDGSGRRNVARLDVNVVGQRGVLGLDTDRAGNTAVSSVRKDGTMIVTLFRADRGVATTGAANKTPAEQTGTREFEMANTKVVYEGRKAKDSANGGHLLLEPDGAGIILGLGDFLEGGKRGRFVRIDTATSAVKVLSVGWNNPFAFDWRDGPRSNQVDATNPATATNARTPSIMVADNSPNNAPEEVAELNGRRFGALPKQSTPSALAMTSSAPLEGVVCSYVSKQLAKYRFTPAATPTGVGTVTKKETLATDCSVAVRLLPDRRLVYATQTHLMISNRPVS